MGFQIGSACYPTAVQAAQAAASSSVGSIISHGTTAYVVDVSSTSDTSITYSFTPLDGGAALVLVTPFTAQPCSLLQLDDGLSIGWMVAGAWLGTYCLLFLARALRGETESNYGNT